jgi:hypothetical protein
MTPRECKECPYKGQRLPNGGACPLVDPGGCSPLCDVPYPPEPVVTAEEMVVCRTCYHFGECGLYGTPDFKPDDAPVGCAGFALS